MLGQVGNIRHRVGTAAALWKDDFCIIIHFADIFTAFCTMNYFGIIDVHVQMPPDSGNSQNIGVLYFNSIDSMFDKRDFA